MNFKSLAICVLCIIFLSGCLPANTKLETETEKGRVVEAHAEPVEELPSVREPLTVQLLKDAEKAFRDGKLLLPAHDNAYDRFQSVLLLEPANSSARGGVQAILIRYAELIRDAISNSRFERAQSLLSRVDTYYPQNGLLLDLRKQLRRAQNRSSSASVVRPAKSSEAFDVVQLSLPALSARSEDVITVLNEVAQRVKSTDESVMIYARNDAEGRWIYKQMKKAVDGYRIRGDIRISRKPKIALLPPL